MEFCDRRILRNTRIKGKKLNKYYIETLYKNIFRK